MTKEMPKQLWANEQCDQFEKSWYHSNTLGNSTKYIRADIVDKMIKELKTTQEEKK